MIIEIVFAVLIGYILGSIPFALVIGKVFYKTDIRHHGSKNLGGGNAGRVLGKRAGLCVMAMDILKVTLAIFITTFFSLYEEAVVAAGLAAALGHCFPVFAHFKGGKAVATMYGFLFGMVVCTDYNIMSFILPLLVFLLVLYLWKMISLASICSAISITIYMCHIADTLLMPAALLIFTILIIIRHRKNISRMFNKEENKISWM